MPEWQRERLRSPDALASRPAAAAKLEGRLSLKPENLLGRHWHAGFRLLLLVVHSTKQHNPTHGSSFRLS